MQLAVERQIREIERQAAPRFAVAESLPLTLMRDGDIGQDRLLPVVDLRRPRDGFGAGGYPWSHRVLGYPPDTRGGDSRQRRGAAAMCCGFSCGNRSPCRRQASSAKMLYEVSPSAPADIAIALLGLSVGGLLAAHIPATEPPASAPCARSGTTEGCTSVAVDLALLTRFRLH
jgi:hypothetical protein